VTIGSEIEPLTPDGDRHGVTTAPPRHMPLDDRPGHNHLQRSEKHKLWGRKPPRVADVGLAAHFREQGVHVTTVEEPARGLAGMRYSPPCPGESGVQLLGRLAGGCRLDSVGLA
jgi:hypothetical protein